MLRIFVFLLAALFAFNCSKPSTGRELDGKVKGKAKLRLADGSTISQDDSDEYHPQIVALSDGYLVLAFGSDRSDPACTLGTHNIFIAKSLAPYDGLFLPFFDTPRPLKNEGICVADPGRINFALVPDGTGVKVYLNYHSQPNQIWVAPVTDPSNPAPAFAAITNANHIDNTVIGANASGDRLITTDLSGVAYVVNPDINTAADPYGFGLNYAESALQVRQEVSGYDDAYIASIYGGTMATTSSFPFGPIIDLDFSLIGSGLYLGSLGAFYSSDAYGDLVLFSAYDEFSEDMYVITSHTAGGLWNIVGFFGGDIFLPTARTPEHFYTFNGGTCGVDEIGTWDVTCSGVSVGSVNLFDGSDYGEFGGAAQMDLGAQSSLGTQFTLTAWVYMSTGASGLHTIVANAGGTATVDGFRLYVDASDGMRLKFVVGDSTFSETIASFADAVLPDTWNHVAVVVNTVNQSVYLYSNGTQWNDTQFGWGSTVTSFQTTSNVVWGATSAAPTNNLTGALENVRIHMVELSASEVIADVIAY